MKKVFTVLCLLALLVGCFSACKSDKTPTDGSTTPDNSQTTVAPGEESDPEYTPSIDLSAKDFDKTTIRILQCDYKQTEFNADSSAGGETVAAEVFRRNALVELDLNIFIEYPTVANPTGQHGPLKSAVSRSVLGGDPNSMFHVVANPAYYVTSLIAEGLYMNLADIPDSNIDIGKRYWSQNYIEESVLNDRYYFLVGELCTSVIERTEVMYVNKLQFENYFPDAEESIYETVYGKKWTYGRMLEMIAKAGDGDSIGTYGLTLPISSWSIDGMLAALKLDMLTRDSYGIPKVNANTSHNYDLITALRDLYYNNPSVETNDYSGLFRSGNAVFTSTLLMESGSFYDAGIKYSIIPQPMWDESQDDYVVTPHDEYTSLSICSNVTNTDAVTAFLEDMAYRSHSTTYPAVFQTTYRLRYSENPEDAEMFDFIYERLSFSMGAIYSYVLGECKNVPRYLIYPQDRGVTPNVTYPVQSTLTSLAWSMETDLATFLEIFYSVK